MQRYLADEPVQACPPSARYRLRKFVRRNKQALATAGVAALAVLLTVGTLGWAVRDRGAREEELVRDRAARETALDGEVQLALGKAGALIDDSKSSEAFAVVERTEKLLAAAGRQELPQRLQELRKDLVMAQRLEDIYSRPKKSDIYSRPQTEEFFAGRELDAAYAEAFADYGIDLGTLSAEEAAEKIARGAFAWSWVAPWISGPTRVPLGNGSCPIGGSC